MYNLNNNGSEAEEKWHENYLLKRQDMLAGDLVVSQGKLAREHVFSAQGTQFRRLV